MIKAALVVEVYALEVKNRLDLFLSGSGGFTHSCTCASARGWKCARDAIYGHGGVHDVKASF